MSKVARILRSHKIDTAAGHGLMLIALAGSSHGVLAASDCLLNPGNPNPVAQLDPYFVQMSFVGGVDASSSGPQMHESSTSCSGLAGFAQGISKDTPDKNGSLSVSFRAGLDAGLNVGANASGSVTVAGSGEIIVHNQREQPTLNGIAPAGTPLHGHFAFILEGTNLIEMTNLVFIESLIEMDISVSSTSSPTAWTADATGLHHSAEIAFFPPGPAEFRRVEFDLAGTVIAGETIDTEMHIFDTVRVSGTDPSSDRGKGAGTLSQDLSSTFAYDFIPDNPAITAKWASDPYFGGAQPTINTVPLPASLPLLLGALCVGMQRRRKGV